MANKFHSKIEKRGIEVFTCVPMHLGEGHYEIQFRGHEPLSLFADKKIPDQSIRLWYIDEDHEGSIALKVHKAAVGMLEKGEPMELVYKRVNWLIEHVRIELQRIDELAERALNG